MQENKFKQNLCRKLKQMFPGCLIDHTNPNERQGAPDILIRYKNKWASLEGKKSYEAYLKDIDHPNQGYYVELENGMSFSRYIYPENEKEVLDELRTFFS